MERWMLKNIKFDYRRMMQELNCSEIIAKILVNRGISEKDTAHRFLNPCKEQLYGARLMKDIEKGASIIKDAINRQLKILVVGDYDVDGVISTYLLFSTLRKCNADVSYHIPDRVEEGYGINASIVRKAALDKFDVIITCDNGISAIDQVNLAKELGITVIITDHHDIPFKEDESGNRVFVVPNADAVINPKQFDCQYPFKSLCGAGVAFKFIQVLLKNLGFNNDDSYNLLEYVAIATVCDVVDLVDENRIIVKQGLEIINKTNNCGIRALCEETGLLGKKINVYSLGFVIGPSINASGRLDQALWALKLLLSEDYSQAKELAKRLHEFNKERQELTRSGVELAMKIIESSNIKNDRVLVLFLPDVHESIAGIIAGRIRERYNCPTIILTKSKEGVKGSGRSIEEYNMYEELIKCKELLGRFGGHPMAAGLSLKEENIDSLRLLLNSYCQLDREDMIPKVSIDMALPIEMVDINLAEELQVLEPFGKRNPKPCFADKNIRVIKAIVLGANKNVLKLKLASKLGRVTEAVYFGDIDEFDNTIVNIFGRAELDKMYNGYESKVFIDLAYSISINEYMNDRNAQILINNYRTSLSK